MSTEDSLRVEFRFSVEEQVLSRVLLTPGTHTVGRGHRATVKVVHDSLSREHARLVIDSQRNVTVEDLRSLNGTFINQEKVTATTPLREEDHLRLGDVEVQVTRGAPSQKPQRPAYLVFLDAPRRGRVVTADQSSSILGRGRDCTVSIEDSTVSRRHARLEPLPQGDGWLLEDLESANGTTVDGANIQQCILKGGETIQLGDVRLLFGGRERPNSRRKVLLLVLLMVGLGGAIAALLYNLFVIAGQLPP